MSRKFTCPYCFNTIDASKVYFYCENPDCEQDDWERTEFELDRPLINENEVQSHRTVFQIQRNFLLNWLRIKPPHDINCPYCQVRTSTRACPHCHSSFPNGIDKLSNMIIAIIGDKDTGKSNYIAVLIQRILDLYDIFDWSLLELDDATVKLYNKVFYQPLYKDGFAVEVTQSATDEEGEGLVKQPLLYQLSIIKGRKLKSITLAFFDTAGEDLRGNPNDDTIKSMEKINRYIKYAAGIILLLDPLSIEGIKSQLSENSYSPTVADSNISREIISRTSTLLFQRFQRNKTIPTPIAITFSKVDLLENVLTSESRVYKPSRHQGVFNLNDFNEISGDILGWINTTNARTLLGATKLFQNTAFFGVSALGCDPIQTTEGRRKKLTVPEPRPIRVEDPFLWLLYKNNFIRRK